MGLVAGGPEDGTVAALGCDVLDIDGVDDKLIPPKASERSETLGTQASTLKRRSTLSPAKFCIKHIIEFTLRLSTVETLTYTCDHAVVSCSILDCSTCDCMLEGITEAPKLPRWNGFSGFLLAACKDHRLGSNKLNIDAERPVHRPCRPSQELPQVVPVADKV